MGEGGGGGRLGVYMPKNHCGRERERENSTCGKNNRVGGGGVLDLTTDNEDQWQE